MEIFGFRFLCVDDNPDLLMETYRLRYKVYCRETKFLDDDKYQDEIEQDEYDAHSIHFAAVDTHNNVVGTLRLILPLPDKPFPLESHCPNYYKSKVEGFPRENLAEISRLVVDRTWRRRKNDGLHGMGSYHPDRNNPIPEKVKQKRKRPVIVFGLYKVMYMECKRRGITHWYAAMEQKLNNTLRKFSFEFKAIGPEQDYYGPVTPFLAEISDIEKTLYAEKSDVMHLMAYGLEKKHMPKVAFPFPLRNFLFIKTAKILGKI